MKAPKDGFVFIAIPYEAGWSVTVDGAPAERWKGCEGFTAFKVPAGEHEFRMHYLVPGLKKGILLSVFSVILFVLFSFIGKKRDPHRTQYEPDGAPVRAAHAARPAGAGGSPLRALV